MSNELLDQFLNYIKFEKRLSELTIKNYQNDINRLILINDKKTNRI
jgi:integrase/recombinase XerC